MEHIIVRIIGFNQAELFLGFPLSLRSNQSLLLANSTETIRKLCNIKLENPKNAVSVSPPPRGACVRSCKKLMSSTSSLVTIKKYRNSLRNHWNKFRKAYMLYLNTRRESHRIEWGSANCIISFRLPRQCQNAWTSCIQLHSQLRSRWIMYRIKLLLLLFLFFFSLHSKYKFFRFQINTRARNKSQFSSPALGLPPTTN